MMTGIAYRKSNMDLHYINFNVCQEKLQKQTMQFGFVLVNKLMTDTSLKQDVTTDKNIQRHVYQ